MEELELDSIQIVKLTDDLKIRLESYPNLASLTLNDCSLRSLENFPNVISNKNNFQLPNLIRLELIDNKLTGDKLKVLKDCLQL